MPIIMLSGTRSTVPATRTVLTNNVSIVRVAFHATTTPTTVGTITSGYPSVLINTNAILGLSRYGLTIRVNTGFVISPNFSTRIISCYVTGNVTIAPNYIAPARVATTIGHNLGMVGFFPTGVCNNLGTVGGLSTPFINIGFLPANNIGTNGLQRCLSTPFVRTMNND